MMIHFTQFYVCYQSNLLGPQIAIDMYDNIDLKVTRCNEFCAKPILNQLWKFLQPEVKFITVNILTQSMTKYIRNETKKYITGGLFSKRQSLGMGLMLNIINTYPMRIIDNSIEARLDGTISRKQDSNYNFRKNYITKHPIPRMTISSSELEITLSHYLFMNIQDLVNRYGLSYPSAGSKKSNFGIRVLPGNKTHHTRLIKYIYSEFATGIT